jgi:molybdopterin molybdotransferase
VAKLADLLSADEAQARILKNFGRLETEIVPLKEARGRVLASSISSNLSVPPFANSSMDGFALASADTTAASKGNPVQLRVAIHIAAGSAEDARISQGTCARIMTGAPLPAGADAVIPFEDVLELDQAIEVSSPAHSGACVRPSGQDVIVGQVILVQGTELAASHLALLASTGNAEAPVVRRPRVTILSTGDELVSPGSPLKPGQIYNSNSPMLAAAVDEAGGRAEVLRAAEDSISGLTDALRSAANADLIVTSGGASVGDHDHMTDVVAAHGEIGFWRVRVRPGKPLLFGKVFGKAIIGLPGNPTSAMVTFELFVRPVLRTMLGAAPFRPTILAIVEEKIDNRGGRRTFARVRLSYRDGAFRARLAGQQDSAMVRPLAAADGLLVIPEDREEMRVGEVGSVQVWRLPLD